MMGYSLPSDDNPIVKAANCILVLTQKDLHRPQPEMPCINCGECVRVCPARLLPQQLHWQLRNQLWQDAAIDGLGDCIECGCCDFVCPSHIPLTDRFRGGKLDLKDRESERLRAAHSKNRYQARENRLRRESLEQEVLQTKKKHAMRLDAQQRIAAATERAKSHPAVGNPDSGNTARDDGESE
jgi:electron transport complex protein RnfC